MPIFRTLTRAHPPIALVLGLVLGLGLGLVAPGPASGGEAQLLAFERQAEADLARSGHQPVGPDGQPDAVLRFTLQAPGDRLTGVRLRSVSGGVTLGWTTDPRVGWWRGALLAEGRLLNEADAPVDLPLGREPVTLAFHVAPDQYLPRLFDGATGFELDLTLASGRPVVLPVPAGFERAAAAPTPPPPPVVDTPAPQPVPPPPAAAGPAPQPAPADTTEAWIERVFWESILASTDPAEYRAYLDRWPEGTFADLARLRIDRLAAPAATGETVPDDPDTWALEVNARFGTRIRYPADGFAAQPLADNADGRQFLAVGGGAQFRVFGQHDAFLTPVELTLRQDLALGRFDRVLDQDWSAGGYAFTALRGTEIVHRRLLMDGLNAVLHVFEGSYPAARADTLGPLFAQIAETLDFTLDDQPATPEPVPAPVPDLGGVAGDGLPSRPPRDPAAYRTPERNTPLRQELIDAARAPVAQELGRHLLFRVDALRTAGDWAYLQGVPLEADGTPFDWRRSPYARDWAADVMSDVVMVLLIRDRAGWRALNHVIGPTDVAWLDWAELYGLPEALFFGP